MQINRKTELWLDRLRHADRQAQTDRQSGFEADNDSIRQTGR